MVTFLEGIMLYSLGVLTFFKQCCILIVGYFLLISCIQIWRQKVGSKTLICFLMYFIAIFNFAFYVHYLNYYPKVIGNVVLYYNYFVLHTISTTSSLYFIRLKVLLHINV